jgi:Family of unknown function (DUF5681)
MTDDSKDANTVGYKRPPSHTRFRPGHSGNPSGRPKRKPTFRTALLQELAAIMPGKDPQRAGSKLQALVKTLVDAAIAGDARAQSLLIGALARMGDAEENEVASLTADDQEILDAYTHSEVKDGASETDSPSLPGDDDDHAN